MTSRRFASIVFLLLCGIVASVTTRRASPSRRCRWRRFAGAKRSSSLVGVSSRALRSIDSVGSISRRRRSSASVRNTSQASPGASKYSRRSPGRWRSRTRRHDCNSFSPMLTLERLNSSFSAMSSAFSGAGETKISA